jgi:hypothetical protein
VHTNLIILTQLRTQQRNLLESFQLGSLHANLTRALLAGASTQHILAAAADVVRTKRDGVAAPNLTAPSVSEEQLLGVEAHIRYVEAKCFGVSSCPAHRNLTHILTLSYLSLSLFLYSELLMHRSVIDRVVGVFS